MGTQHSYNFLLLKLQQLWSKLRGRWNLKDLENDYYIVKFEFMDDLNSVLFGKPWLVTGHYLALQKWKHSFHAQQDTIQHLIVWVCVTGLSAEWFDPEIMRRIGNLIGITHKVDYRTTTHIRGIYASVCGTQPSEKIGGKCQGKW